MTHEARNAEHQKYIDVYRHENYRMGQARYRAAVDALRQIPDRGEKTLLDVGAGRGEMVDEALRQGFASAKGVEVVSYLCNDRISYGEAYDLPYPSKEFDVVTMFDVIEHLLPEDTEQTLTEIIRVAKTHIVITAANYSSRSLGQELHINIKTYDEWDQTFRDAWPSAMVRWLSRTHGTNSETWLVTL